MNYIDIFILLPLLWGIWSGFQRGLILMLGSIVALGLGIYGAILFSDVVANFLTQTLNFNSKYLSLIAFSITFLLLVVAIHLIAHLVNTLFEIVALGFVTKLLGAILGLLKWLIIVSVILSVLNAVDAQFHFLPQEKLRSSMLYDPVSRIAPAIFDYFKFEKIIQ
ncbi:MAG TPA: CvpA family protein [Salinivirgaceae bacterium]|nr:CvpA family protein [Salinivirgaceae bacterium]